ncbi:hypothetical protein CKM354_001016600 [Cercospora kikuchii]|uniref:Beta-lactamase-related domain-containing protein n=1 Tax=Cercospora kikuchii TaxID=84275 RepID=A0A9P3CWH1_9PEZI|nr:uncharacterized protein CKM354_001016600 [Cercospora kikuchii]GIZ47065.1 hypothetical protein CKM354_001016600 [Cercospora kikuchii]
MDFFLSPQCGARVSRLLADHHVVGLAVSLVQGRRLESRAYGKATRNPPLDFTADTAVPVGSAAKCLTAAAVALLVADDAHPDVQWEAEMRHLLPTGFALPGASDVTVSDLLCHRTGLPRHELALLGSGAARPDDARSITRKLRHLALAAPPRQSFIYCNLTYTVASYLVEAKSGEPFAAYLERRLFEPLHMHSTCLGHGRATAKALRIAEGYSWDRKSKQHCVMPHIDGAELQGAGNIFSTAEDYAKWIRAMMQREDPITEHVFNALTESRICQDADLDLFYAFGWDVRRYQGHTLLLHTGGEAGSATVHFFIADLQFGGAIVSNSAHADSLLGQLMYLFIDEALRSASSPSVPDMSQLALGEESPDTASECGSVASSEDHVYSIDDAVREEEQIMQDLCPGIKTSQPLLLPLEVYTGRYWNPGYQQIIVQARADQLFADSSERSCGFTLTYKHICDNTKFIAYMRMAEGGNDIPLSAVFEIENNRALKVGIRLEDMLPQHIWFSRLEASSIDGI